MRGPLLPLISSLQNMGASKVPKRERSVSTVFEALWPPIAEETHGWRDKKLAHEGQQTFCTGSSLYITSALLCRSIYPSICLKSSRRSLYAAAHYANVILGISVPNNGSFLQGYIPHNRSIPTGVRSRGGAGSWMRQQGHSLGLLSVKTTENYYSFASEQTRTNWASALNTVSHFAMPLGIKKTYYTIADGAVVLPMYAECNLLILEGFLLFFFLCSAYFGTLGNEILRTPMARGNWEMVDATLKELRSIFDEAFHS